MMRTVKLTLLVAGFGLMLAATDARAHGLLRRGGHGGDCAPAPECVTVAATPQYVERVVTRYRHITKEREVTDVVCRMIPREEKYTYTVSVPTTRTEVR